jgi:hypothetical protein
MRPTACQPYRPRTKGKVERPFFYLEQQFIKGTRFASLSHFLEELAAFERDDLDVRVHTTTQERPIDRFERELPHLTPLPEQRFVGTLAMSRKVSWDCLVSYQGNRYSVPATYAGKMVWLLPSRGSQLVVLDAKRDVLAEHRVAGWRWPTSRPGPMAGFHLLRAIDVQLPARRARRFCRFDAVHAGVARSSAD